MREARFNNLFYIIKKLRLVVSGLARNVDHATIGRVNFCDAAFPVTDLAGRKFQWAARSKQYFARYANCAA